MGQLTDNEIYRLWLSHTKDLRYLRHKRWEQIRSLIESNRLRSALEFGSGVSTLLFDNLGIKTVSYETNMDFINFVKPFCTARVKFIHWNNKHFELSKRYDLALIDGILPRVPQLLTALGHVRYVVLDDFVGSVRASEIGYLSGLKRLDDESTPLAIYWDPPNE